MLCSLFSLYCVNQVELPEEEDGAYFGDGNGATEIEKACKGCESICVDS